MTDKQSGGARQVESYLTRKAQARLDPSAVVYVDNAGKWILERAGVPDRILGENFGRAKEALYLLIAALQSSSRPGQQHRPIAMNANGDLVDVGSGITPILTRTGEGKKFRVIGTAFFVTRYGLMVTAKHVLEELLDPVTGELTPAFILENRGTTNTVQRFITRASFSKFFDVAVFQVQNGLEAGRPAGPMNLVPNLSLDVPPVGAQLVSYAFPENRVVDFSAAAIPAVMAADFYQGRFLDYVPANSRGLVRYPHYETTLEIRSGASGCPVFCNGSIVGIASTGWTFHEEGEAQEPLSAVLPIRLLLHVEVECAQIPTESWEYASIPEPRRGAVLTFGELIAYGHINPPRPAAPPDDLPPNRQTQQES